MEALGFKIRWQEKISKIPLNKTMIPVRTIECLMYKGESIPTGHVGRWGNGQAFCSPLDVFNKDKGRKLSLLRAMKSAYLTKEQRGVIWDAYRNMKKGGRW